MLTRSLLLAISCFLGCCAEFYVIDDRSGLGREFDGIGGLSGGGVNHDNVFNLTNVICILSTVESVTNLLSLTGHFTTSCQL